MARLITVIGGSGFVGRHVVTRLAHLGYRVRVAVRHPNSALFLQPAGGVGQIQFIQTNIRDMGSVERAVEGADGCVNLVGLLFQSGKQKFAAVHTEGAGNAAQAAARAGVSRFIQVSAIGADKASPSRYARTKAAGEAAVLDAFPAATIIRPSIIFGPEDGFFNRFATLAKIPLMPMPLIGGKTRFQPVYVGDVAAAIIKAATAEDDSYAGTFELGGPKVYSLRELMQYTLDVIGSRKLLIPVPIPLAKLEATFLGLLPKPLLTVDQVKQLQIDNIVGADAQGIEAFRIKPQPVEVIVPEYLGRFRKKGQFAGPPTGV